jgi:hypothetical protein
MAGGAKVEVLAFGDVDFEIEKKTSFKPNTPELSPSRRPILHYSHNWSEAILSL